MRPIIDVIDRTPKICDPADPVALPQPLQGEFRFDHVAFSYPTRRDAPVFRDLSLTIPAGKRVAFVRAARGVPDAVRRSGAD